MPLPQYGPFAAAFERDGLSVPGYLALLHLHSEEAHTVIGRIERGLAKGDPSRLIKALLTDVNWRPHLVAAVAYLLPAGRVMDAAPCGRPLMRAVG